jgi:hypothetical protein
MPLAATRGLLGGLQFPYAPGRVIQQDPPAGTAVEPGTAVNELMRKAPEASKRAPGSRLTLAG